MGKTDNHEIEREALLPMLSQRLLKLACEGHWRVQNDPGAALDFLAACRHAGEFELVHGEYRLTPEPELFCLRVEKLHKPPLGNGYQTVAQLNVPFSGEHFLCTANAGSINAASIPQALDKLETHLRGLVGLAVMSRVL